MSDQPVDWDYIVRVLGLEGDGTLRSVDVVADALAQLRVAEDLLARVEVQLIREARREGAE